jgi:hypothetical protein
MPEMIKYCLKYMYGLGLIFDDCTVEMDSHIVEMPPLSGPR